MTAFAIDFRQDRITIVADSLVYLPSRTEVRPIGQTTKVLPLHHLRAALFSRGQFQITATVFGQLLVSPQLGSIEAVAHEVLPTMLRDVTDQYCDQIGVEDRTSLSVLDIGMCGWSAAEGRMRVWQYCNSVNDYAPMTAGDAPYGIHTSPTLTKEFFPTSPLGASVNERCIGILEAIGRQCAADPAYARMRLGGDIVATEITPDGIAQRTIARWPGYEDEGAAVYEHMMSGEIDTAAAVRDGLTPVTWAPTNDRASPMNRQQRRAAERQARAEQRQRA